VNAVTKTRVYLVDDDDAVRDSLRLLLESYGMEVRDYSSAEDFLREIEEGENSCLISDLHLPVVGGFDLIRIMRRRRIDLPVILITGGSNKDTGALAIKAGVVAILEKPVTEEVLMEAVQAGLSVQGTAPDQLLAGVNVRTAQEHQFQSPS
jgi:two-component system, LuxR family, response regulator FixJ